MELSERIEWEVARVVAAFGLEEWESVESESPFLRYATRSYQSENIWEWVTWELNPHDGTIFSLEVSDYARGCQLFDASCLIDEEYMNSERNKYWVLYDNPRYNGRMASALYCLGFEDEDVLTELNHPLSAHEKVELRLSMPREFWPQTWLDEELP